MRILILSKPDTSISYFYKEFLIEYLRKKGHEVLFNPSTLPVNFEVCLYSENTINGNYLENHHPDLKLILVDPKMNDYDQISNLRSAHGVIVSSIEQYEMASKYNENILINYWFRYQKKLDPKRKNAKSENLRIVYHGNKKHLECIGESLGPALERLNKIYRFEFIAIYNISKLGLWKVSRPKNIKIKDLQWNHKTYLGEIAKCDIGVIPNFIPVRNSYLSFLVSKSLTLIKFRTNLNINRNDYNIRFKHNSNPGRAYEFALLGLPVVAEATISMSQLISHGKSGYLVLSEDGWFNCLSILLKDATIRKKIGSNFNLDFMNKYRMADQLKDFEKFISIHKLKS